MAPSKKGHGKHCAYGTCHNNSGNPGMEKIRFIPFPKPTTPLGRTRAKKWIAACRRNDLDVTRITRGFYVCSQHFIHPSGPTELNPDPIPATSTEAQRSRRRPKRISLDMIRKRSKKNDDQQMKTEKGVEESPSVLPTTDIGAVEVLPSSETSPPPSKESSARNSPAKEASSPQTSPGKETSPQPPSATEVSQPPSATEVSQPPSEKEVSLPQKSPKKEDSSPAKTSSNVSPTKEVSSNAPPEKQTPSQELPVNETSAKPPPRLIKFIKIAPKPFGMKDTSQLPLVKISHVPVRKPPLQTRAKVNSSMTVPVEVILKETNLPKIQIRPTLAIPGPQLSMPTDDVSQQCLKFVHHVMKSCYNWYVNMSPKPRECTMTLTSSEDQFSKFRVLVHYKNFVYSSRIQIGGRTLANGHPLWKSGPTFYSGSDVVKMLQELGNWRTCYSANTSNDSKVLDTCELLCPFTRRTCEPCCSKILAVKDIVPVSQTRPDPRKNIRFMSHNDLELKLKLQRKTIKTERERMRRMEKKLDKLTAKIGPEPSKEVIGFEESLKKLTDEQNMFIQQQIKAAGAKGSAGMRWNPTIIKWCIYLMEKSPRGYRLLRNSKFMKLPSKRTLKRYEPRSEKVDEPKETESESNPEPEEESPPESEPKAGEERAKKRSKPVAVDNGDEFPKKKARKLEKPK